jgi:ABC-2 type transport system permease protein
MSVLKPGSYGWLLAHELTLLTRGRSRGSTTAGVLVIGGITLLMFLVGVPTALALRHIHIGPNPALVVVFDLVVAVLFTLLLSQTLAQATLALFERGDLDLLLSSPLPPRRVLAVRFLSIATMPFLIFAALVTPFILPLAVLGHPGWLGAYGVLGSLALSATAVGLIVAMGLFATIGPRHTKVIGQVIAAFTGALFFLGSQARYILGHNNPFFLAVVEYFQHAHFAHDGGLASWPARAIMGEAVPLTVIVAGSLVLFFGTSAVLGARFAANAAVAAGMDERRNVRTRRSTKLAFRGGVFASLIRKELKLLWRDPALLSQVLLRALYLIPVLFVLLRNAAMHASSTVASGAGGLVFTASQLAASLAWITISAEDSPELLASAPVSTAAIRRAKILAALLPIAVVFGAGVIPLLYFSPLAAVVAGAGIACASLSTALINLWYEKPAQRKNFRRRSSGSLLSSLAEFLVGLAWAAAAVLGASARPIALAATAFALLLLGAFYLARPKA